MKQRAKNVLMDPEPERLDLVVRGGKVVTPDGITEADLGIREGKIVQVAPEIADDTNAVLEADGRYVFPGIIDAHVHFNEPGRAEWKGWPPVHSRWRRAAGPASSTCR